MKTRLLFSILCALIGLQAGAEATTPGLWPDAYICGRSQIKADQPFVYPLKEISVKFNCTIKQMEDVTDPVVVKCDGAVVVEATELEISNYVGSTASEGYLIVYFEKQDLPKGKTYELCIPEGIVGSTEIEDGCRLVNAASVQEFSVPVSLDFWYCSETEGMKIPNSKRGFNFFWKFEIEAVGEPKFDLYREGEKIAELRASVSYDWDLGCASPVFDVFMTFDTDVNYTLVLPAGSVSTLYREDITNEEVVFNFVGGEPELPEPFTYTWCSLSTDLTDTLGEVTFVFDRPIMISENAIIQLCKAGRIDTVIMEVTPWINYDANSWLLECDFGGYQLEENVEYKIVMPYGTVISADDRYERCVRREFIIKYTGIEDITVDESKSQPFYNLQGIKEVNPIPGRIYIHNGRKVIVKR